MNRDAIGLRKLHKLTDEHINLTPRLRMRVNLAAQVSLFEMLFIFYAPKLVEYHQCVRIINHEKNFAYDFR